MGCWGYSISCLRSKLMRRSFKRAIVASSRARRRVFLKGMSDTAGRSSREMPKRWIHKAYTDQLQRQLFGIEQKYLKKGTTLSMDILYDPAYDGEDSQPSVSSLRRC